MVRFSTSRKKARKYPLAIESVTQMLGLPIVKSPVVAATAVVPSDFKSVEMVDPQNSSQTIEVKTIRLTALSNPPPKRFQETDKTPMIINGDPFECPGDVKIALRGRRGG